MTDTQWTQNSDNVQNRQSMLSDTFTAYEPKRFPGPLEPTTLSRCLYNQGIKMRIRKEYRRQAYVIECCMLLAFNTGILIQSAFFSCWTIIVWMQKRQLQGNAVFKSLTANNSVMHHQQRQLAASQTCCINDPNMNGLFFQHMLRMMHTLANGKQLCLRSSRSSSMPQASHHLPHPLPVQLLLHLTSVLRAITMQPLRFFTPPVVGEVNYRHWKQSWMTVSTCWFMIGLYHLHLIPFARQRSLSSHPLL